MQNSKMKKPPKLRGLIKIILKKLVLNGYQTSFHAAFCKTFQTFCNFFEFNFR